MQAMAAAAKKIKTPEDWLRPAELSRDQKEELRRWKHAYYENTPTQWFPQGAATMILYSDASNDTGAYFGYDIESQEMLVTFQTGMNIEEHIFVKELRMAVKAILAASALGRVPHLFVDNMPVLHALHRRLSTNFVANRLLSRLIDCQYSVSWVASAQNLADSFTRGAKFHRHLTYQDVLERHHIHANRVGGSQKEEVLTRKTPWPVWRRDD